MLDLALLQKMWPRGDSIIPGLLEGIAATAPVVLPKYGITSPIALAVMMGEFTEECGGGTEVVENLNYRAAVLHAQWPSHFTMDQALAMQHNPRAIANQAYNGRMGNRLGTDDGYLYRGRGPAQTTGRAAYLQLGQIMGLDLVGHPDLINDPQHFLECGVADFVKICGCLPYAERDDEVNATRHLNGGLIGLQQRQVAIALWKQPLGVN